MARRAEDLKNDPVLQLINPDEVLGSLDEWLERLHEIEPTNVDANAAEIIRDIREHGER